MQKLTTREAAEYLRLAPRTLERWRIQGIGPRFFKVGGRRVVYSVEELRQFLAAGERTSTSDHGGSSRP
ncbi:MAG TPA: helix-turn-helix domain-containing protein [Thermoanaerobaculia bacterium]|jgi:excisionase family DNA binding protein|nr:MAG: Helix-turn-helix domain protein [Acidobacteria bacterium ADurb.Bin051]HNU82688.1 helix-turn-helix domain-containing protein [Thermoanaerobaculia bacterium]